MKADQSSVKDCYQIIDRSDRGFKEADKASSVAASGRGGAKGRQLACSLVIVLGSRDQSAPSPALAGPQLRNFLFNRPNSEQLEKGNCYRISALLPKKITGSFGVIFVLVFFFWVLIHKALTEKVLCETKLICAAGRWWLLLVRGNEDGTGGFGELVWSPVSTRMLVM